METATSIWHINPLPGNERKACFPFVFIAFFRNFANHGEDTPSRHEK
jgi:hypothetical protein